MTANLTIDEAAEILAADTVELMDEAQDCDALCILEDAFKDAIIAERTACASRVSYGMLTHVSLKILTEVERLIRHDTDLVCPDMAQTTFFGEAA